MVTALNFPIFTRSLKECLSKILAYLVCGERKKEKETVELSKYKKMINFGAKNFFRINDFETPTKKEERKKGKLPKPFPSLSFFRPNKSIIQNYENSKRFELSKTKNATKFGKKNSLGSTNIKNQQKRRKEIKGNLPKPFPSFSFFRPNKSIIQNFKNSKRLNL